MCIVWRCFFQTTSKSTTVLIKEQSTYVRYPASHQTRLHVNPPDFHVPTGTVHVLFCTDWYMSRNSIHLSIFFSAHDVFGQNDPLTLTLTLCPNPPLSSAPSLGAPPNARYAGVSAVFPTSHHVQKIKKIRDQIWSRSFGFRAIILTRWS